MVLPGNSTALFPLLSLPLYLASPLLKVLCCALLSCSLPLALPSLPRPYACFPCVRAVLRPLPFALASYGICEAPAPGFALQSLIVAARWPHRAAKHQIQRSPIHTENPSLHLETDISTECALLVDDVIFEYSDCLGYAAISPILMTQCKYPFSTSSLHFIL